MRRTLALLALLAWPAAAGAQPAPSIQVSEAWSRAAPAGRTGALFLTATDTGKPDTLLGVETDAAERTELHESISENGVMKMRSVPSITVASGQPLVLRPGGYHVMLINLRHDLKEGDSIPVTLKFAGAGAISTMAQVRKAGAPGSAETHDHIGGSMAR